MCDNCNMAEEVWKKWISNLEFFMDFHQRPHPGQKPAASGGAGGWGATMRAAGGKNKTNQLRHKIYFNPKCQEMPYFANRSVQPESFIGLIIFSWTFSCFDQL